MNTEFTNDQNSLAYPDGVEKHYWHRARNRIVADEIRRVSGERAKVLDIGAGRGITVKYLRDRHIDCLGVELGGANPLAGVEAFIKYGCGAADLADDERKQYQVILLLDVLEHLSEPDAFVRELLLLFPNCRHFIITLPACPELWSNYDEFYGHYRRYTMSMIDELAAKLNLEIEHAGYFFRIFYLPARLLTYFNRTRSCIVKPPRGIGLFIHKLVTTISLIEYSTLPKSLHGTSIIASLARRP